MRKMLVAGNWKMNGRSALSRELVGDVLAGLAEVDREQVDVLVCPPAVYLSQVCQQTSGQSIKVGAQDLSEFADGAYTGELSAQMLVDIGCEAVIVGHSERRALFGDSDARVAEKLRAALAADLMPLLCVGETLEQRDSGLTLDVVSEQLRSALVGLEPAKAASVVLAYEPVWAIGTGRTATPEQAQEVHAHLRAVLRTLFGELAVKMRIVYGGSVNAGNALELFAQQDIDGGLVGGASLKANEFLAICRAAEAKQNG